MQKRVKCRDPFIVVGAVNEFTFLLFLSTHDQKHVAKSIFLDLQLNAIDSVTGTMRNVYGGRV